MSRGLYFRAIFCKYYLCLGFQTPKLKRYDWTPKTYFLKHLLRRYLEDECIVSHTIGFHTNQDFVFRM